MIEVRDASFAYHPEAPVLDGVSLTVAPGERTVLLGRNGSGKSTLGKLLNGRLEATAGQVLVDGNTSGFARSVGYIQQDPRNQIVSSLVEEEVAFGPRNLGLGREEVLERVDEALEACGIAALRGRLTTELSGGQQQLLALAGVLAMRPRYLVLDEVGSQLDEASRQRVAAVVRALVEKGVGVLEIAHNVEALLGADRALVLAEGRCVWRGAPQELLERTDVLAAAGLDQDELAGVFSRAARAGWQLADGLDSPVLAAEARRGRPAYSSQPCRPCTNHALMATELNVVYGCVSALAGVSLEARGLTLVLGPSGSGKTTLARVMAGVLEADAGSCELDGTPVRAGDVGLAFQRPEDQVFCDTVRDELSYGPRMRGANEGEIATAVAEAARELAVEGLLDRSPFELSGGQMRRVALASVVSARPAAYVFDEPTAGLDAPARRELRDIVRGLVRAGAPAIVVTHDAAEWLDEVAAVVFLAEGRIVATASGDEAACSPELFRAAGLEPPLLVRLRAAAKGVAEDA